MKDRIRQLMEDQHLTQQNFAQLIGTTPATLSNIFNGKTNPSLAIVDGIHKSFPQVNVYWIMYGTPPMYNSQQGKDAGSGTMNGMEDSSPQGMTNGLNTERRGYGDSLEATLDFSAPTAQSSPASPSLFDTPSMHGVNNTPKKEAQKMVKIIDKQQRRITEIRIFYDDQTWETFVPKK